MLFLLHATTPAIALEPRCTHEARRVRTEGREDGKKRKSRPRQEQDRRDDAPNPPLHRIAARWRLCLNRKATCGRLAVSGGVRPGWSRDDGEAVASRGRRRV